MGSQVTIAQDVNLRGPIVISKGTVVHPKASILALTGPIEIGSDCIIEEQVTIINSSPHLAKIGDGNLFEVGSRIESSSIGHHNVFEIKSRVGRNVAIGSYCTISAGCAVWSADPAVKTKEIARVLSLGEEEAEEADQPIDVVSHPRKQSSSAAMSRQTSSTYAIPEEPEEESISSGRLEDSDRIETIPDHSVVFASGPAERRLWSGEGSGQEEALHAKHLDYLRTGKQRSLQKLVVFFVQVDAHSFIFLPPLAIPRSHKLRLIVNN